MVFKISLIFFTIINCSFAKSINPFLENAHGPFLTSSKNTFIFWVNGDSDRFRPEDGIGSLNIRLDSLEVSRLKDFSKNCRCNTIIFHDQRGSNTWYTNKNHFGTFVYAYANGELIQFKKKLFSHGKDIHEKNLKFRIFKYLFFDEVKQDSNFITHLLEFAITLFPKSKYHLVYRGHSFANSLTPQNDIPFDYSHPKSFFHIEEFIDGIKRSGIFFESIVFAACSMSNITLMQELIPYSKYMIASQLNINETGSTGFSFKFLEDVSDDLSIEKLTDLMAARLLENFKINENSTLFMRETPMTLMKLKIISDLEDELEESIKFIREQIASDPWAFERFKVSTRISTRYIETRKKMGMNGASLNLISDKMRHVSNGQDFDLLLLLKHFKFNYLASELQKAIVLYDSSVVSEKSGVSLDLTY